MRRRKRTEFFKLCGLCLATIIINFLSSICTQSLAAALELEERMEVVRKVLKEVPLIDGWVRYINQMQLRTNFARITAHCYLNMSLFVALFRCELRTCVRVWMNLLASVVLVLFYMCCVLVSEEERNRIAAFFVSTILFLHPHDIKFLGKILFRTFFEGKSRYYFCDVCLSVLYDSGSVG